MKLKKLPSMKDKRRYVVFRVHSQDSLDFSNVKDAIWNSLSNWMGDSELGKADVWVMKTLWNQTNQEGFIRCTSKYVDQIKVGLGLIHQIGDSRVTFQTIKVSGTIKAGKE